MYQWAWAGCVIVAAAVSPILAAEDSVEITIHGRLKAQTGPPTITVGAGETARTFTLLLPDDPAMRKAARSLEGKTAVVSGLWERKEVTSNSKAIIKPSTRVVLVNGVAKVVTVSGKAMFEVQKKVIDFVRVKSLSPATQGPAPGKGDTQDK
jgi:hypothetical protein